MDEAPNDLDPSGRDACWTHPFRALQALCHGSDHGSGQIIWTEITLENGTLVTPDGVSLGEIKSFGHEAENGEPSGTLELKLERPDDSEETVTFRKTQE